MMTAPAPRPGARPLSDRAASHVRGLITSGTIRPGSTVRPETVGAELGISATPAREGLQRLTAEGFLVRGAGRGFAVAPLSGEDIRDVFASQALIAGELAARAAARGTAEERQELEALHHELTAHAVRGDTAGVEEKNHAFHRQINWMSRSPKMVAFLGLLNRYVPREFYGAIPGWRDATVEDHGAILTAIQDGDGPEARRTVQRHIHHAGDLLAEHFDARTEVTTAPADSHDPATPIDITKDRKNP